MLTFGCVSASHTSRNRCMEEDMLQGGKGQWKKMQMLTVEDLGAKFHISGYLPKKWDVQRCYYLHCFSMLRFQLTPVYVDYHTSNGYERKQKIQSQIPQQISFVWKQNWYSDHQEYVTHLGLLRLMKRK